MINQNNYYLLEKFLSSNEKLVLKNTNKLLSEIISIKKIKIDILNAKYRKHKDYCKNIFCQNNDTIEISNLFPELTITKYPYIFKKYHEEVNGEKMIIETENNYCNKCINKY